MSILLKGMFQCKPVFLSVFFFSCFFLWQGCLFKLFFKSLHRTCVVSKWLHTKVRQCLCAHIVFLLSSSLPSLDAIINSIGILLAIEELLVPSGTFTKSLFFGAINLIVSWIPNNGPDFVSLQKLSRCHDGNFVCGYAERSKWAWGLLEKSMVGIC